MQNGKQKSLYSGFEGRIGILMAVMMVAYALLGARLWQLQIVRGTEYSEQSLNNRLAFEWLHAPRGIIFGYSSKNPESDKVVLADTRPTCDLVFVPADCSDPEAVAKKLEELVNIDSDALLARVTAEEDEPYKQIIVKRNISKTALMRVEEYSYYLPGVSTIVRSQRRYTYGKTGGQLLGYMNEVTKDELDTQLFETIYKMGDYRGRMGLEREYEEKLRGQDGQTYFSRYASGSVHVQTDAWGNPLIRDSLGHVLKEEMGYQKAPVAGQALQITLDIDLQAKAESLLMATDGGKGAIVVLDADTGAVLALASTPTYDPNIFVTPSRERNEVLTDKENNPMLHRAYEAHYSPGSTFKILLAMAAMEEGVITENTTFTCVGSFGLPGVRRRWRCHKRGGHGAVNLERAIAESCDVYFYNVGRGLEIDNIKKWCSTFSLGELTGIDLPREITGLIPSREWKKEKMQAVYPDNPWEWDWYDGETLNVSIGQGTVTTTPLQNAVLMAAVVNGGRRVRPYLNEALGPQVTEPLVSERTAQAVLNGMRRCVARDKIYPLGTGRQAKIEGMDVIGKTGTIQVVGRDQVSEYKTELDIPYKLRDHAAFIAGVMDREPRIAVSIYVEHGLHGSTMCAPMARELIEFFYDKMPEEPVKIAGTPASSDSPESRM